MMNENKKTGQAEVSASPRKVLNIVKKSVSWTGIILLALLVIIAAWLLVDKFILKSKVPSVFGYSSLIVSTGSMSGTIEEDDVIIIKDTGDYKIGDIITFIQDDEKIPTTHRIVGFTEDGGFKTRGDANNAEDIRTVYEDEICGEVVLTMHKLGLFIGWVGEGGGYIYLLGLVLVIGIGIFLIKDESIIFVGNNASEESDGEEKNKDENDETKGE